MNNHNNNIQIKHVSIRKLEECDYYIINVYTNKLLYKKDIYIGTIENTSGSIRDI